MTATSTQDRQSDPLLRIGEAAKLIGYHAETLRRWDKAGRLTAVKRSPSGQRLYLRSDVLAAAASPETAAP